MNEWSMHLRILLAGLVFLAGCSTTRVAQSEEIRRVADGGTILLTGGEMLGNAARKAKSTIEKHCHGVYEVTEVARTETGSAVSSGSAYSYYGMTTASGGSAKVYGTGITYLCRTPKNPDLNQWLLEMASLDLLGRSCKSKSDCGAFPCGPLPRDRTRLVCTRPDGSVPEAAGGERCDVDADCMVGLVCVRVATRTAAANTCAHP